MRFIPFYNIFIFFLLACSGEKSGHAIKQETLSILGYDLNNPTEVFELPNELEEVSGLAAVPGSYVLSNEDETGTFYLFNLEQGEVEVKYNWGKNGDYEGVSVLDGTAYVLQSSGKIFSVQNYKSTAPEVKEIKTGIDKDCNAEGLTVLPGSNSLLIACKEGGGENRFIYEYDLSERMLRQEPYLRLNLAEIEEKITVLGLQDEDPWNSSGVFYPSGIAFHPTTNDLFILSAKSRLLAVYSKGKLKNVIALTHKAFMQAEGIAFMPNGDLLIGNEGKGGKANILKFNYDQ